MAKRLSSELFVSRLSSYTTLEEFKTLFSPFGAISRARLIRDPNTQRLKGFGFIKFQTESEAERALKAMDGRIIQGRLIFVEFVKNERGQDDTCR